jgi:kynureninase
VSTDASTAFEAEARALDAAAPLIALRGAFVGAKTSLVCFNGNSLGRPPRATVGPQTAVVLLSHVSYRSGYLAENRARAPLDEFRRGSHRARRRGRRRTRRTLSRLASPPRHPRV